MAYEFDIFLSYRRDRETRRWIELHLSPLLKHRVSLELGRDPTIFIDDRIEAGTTWPLELAKSLAASRVLLPLWTKTYFNSKWCVEEFTLMLAREQNTKRRTSLNTRGLVVPAIIHDGEDFPKKFGHIEHFAMQECYNVRMARDGQRAEELDEILKKHAPAIARAIENAPTWQPEWETEAASKFYEMYFDPIPPSQDQLVTFVT